MAFYASKENIKSGEPSHYAYIEPLQVDRQDAQAIFCSCYQYTLFKALFANLNLLPLDLSGTDSGGQAQ